MKTHTQSRMTSNRRSGRPQNQHNPRSQSALALADAEEFDLDATLFEMHADADTDMDAHPVADTFADLEASYDDITLTAMHGQDHGHTASRLHTVPDLDTFIAEGWIGEPLYELKSGKEATAWCCTGGPTSGLPFVVAKYYRPMAQRGFRNDAVYQEGRWDAADRRTRLAVSRGTRAGQQMQFSSWVAHEFRILKQVHAVGTRVPRPITQSDDVVLLEFIGDADRPAQQLKDVRLPREAAQAHFLDLLTQIERILACGYVHGDLSAYNILYWQEQAVIIDFPQAVDAEANPNAAALLERDITNVCTYFARCGVMADPARITHDLWQRWRYGDLRI